MRELDNHKRQLPERCKREEGRILVVQDTTVIDFSGRSNVAGLGHTSISGGSGIMMHTAIAMSEQRLPIGLVGLRLWCRSEQTRGINHSRGQRSTMEKESSKWLWGLDETGKQLSGSGKEIVAYR